ncbi:peptidase inhibitor family I36 protein [Streptosporangium amethystogenes]|uniref:peptidase inhibitor family I36 protein n=1 Tax=Streptosporangium amethystogenes TaxID=2002 RepID=UPI000A04E66E|nr:peptidase inhibitor family I36 protein [Streptosporangium amethystogenes]
MRLLKLVSAGLLAGAVLGGTPAAAYADPVPAWTPAPISDDPAVQDNPTDATATNKALRESGQLAENSLAALAPDWALSCPIGSWCVWTNINGTGYRAAPSGNVPSFSSTFANNDWSAYNNGTSGASVAVYDLTGRVGHLYTQPQYYAWGYLNPGGQGNSSYWL